MLAVEVPSSSTTKPTPDSVVSNPIDRNVKIKVEEVTSSCSNQHNNNNNSSNSSHNNHKSNHNGKVELPKGNHSTQQSLARRKRIFSIDLDPAGFDFESSMAVTFATPSSPVWNGTDSGGDLPPIASLSSSNESSDTHLPSDDSDEVVEIPTRDRCMSLDLSAFVKVEDDNDEDNVTTSRPRGDSIIFDPMSFSDGGIHEEKALLRSSTSYFAENDEMELLNTPVYVNDSTSTKNDNNNNNNNNNKSHSTSIDPPNNPIQSPIIPDPTMNTEHNNNATDSSLGQTSNHTISTETNNPLTSISSSISSIHTPTLTVVTASAGILTTETILPSSAVTTLPTQIVPSSLHGTIPLTTCPMELLNKGGRIGIYLPAARKARIAKFHSKRKMRIWRKRIKYDCRKKLADSRPRIKGRFVKRSNMDDDDEIIAN